MNWSLICAILRSVSQQLKEDPEAYVRFPDLEGVTPTELHAYIRHCHELGYLEVGFADGGPIRIRRMNARGYMALDEICKKRYGNLYSGIHNAPSD